MSESPDCEKALCEPFDFKNAVGRNVMRIRQSRGYTLENVARLTGLSKSYLSKIENGKSVPPLGTLSKIAQAFACEIGHFLRPDITLAEEAVSMVRVHERQPAVRGGTAFGYDYASLAHKKFPKHMEPFIFTLPVSADIPTCFEHDGEEFVFVLQGRVDFETHRGEKEEHWILDKGDSLYMDSSIPHRARSLAPDSRALVVIWQPRSKQF